MIEVPTTVSEACILSSRHSDAYWFLQGDLTVEESAKCCQLINDIEKALFSMSEELKEELSIRDALGEKF